IAKSRETFEERTLIPCTRCEYCMPCPSGVNIPWVFELYNNGKIYDDPNGSCFAYKTFVPENARANKCVECGVCETKCPQGIHISKLMRKVHATLGEGAPY
ncbi:MAG TPA: 4Fe-4S dicluster domain-containing protein, partial [Spirochaetota bacterium]